ncbi:MAG: hypothetical protein Q8O56_17470 [Solirubrobacteraceae bacterium]|nr:hypothetical protein [Solirubrobacteraceae bacterium]
MAKKKSASRADAVRDAVDQAFKAQLPRERISELLDEIGSTAGRLRGAVEELRPATDADIKALRAELEAQRSEIEQLMARVVALETKPKSSGAARAATPAKRTSAAKPAKKPAAKPRAARKKPPAGEPPASA